MNHLNSDSYTTHEIYCADCGRRMPQGYRHVTKDGQTASPLCPMCLGAALQRQIFVSGCCE